jgi:hypothetical protein
MIRRLCGSVLIALLIAACGTPDGASSPVEPPPITPPVVPPPAPQVARLILTPYATDGYSGMRTQLHVRAVDRQGLDLPTDAAVVRSSDESVVAVVRATVFTLVVNGTTVRSLMNEIALVAPGTAVVRVSLQGVTDSVTIVVRPFELMSNALVVESFSVAEYRLTCSWACPYLAYAPLLKLREPSGKSPATVIGFEFSVPTLSTGLCSGGDVRYAPGEVEYLSGIDPFFYNNDLVLMKANGLPVPDGPAKARILVRGADGKVGFMEVTGPIQRAATNTELPPPRVNVSWGCPYPESSG